MTEEARHRFDQACAALRPELHRFCTRMVGDPCDGDDVLHDALVLALYRLGELRDGAALRAWLFRIAHNKCIDFLRVRRRLAARREELDEDAPTQEQPMADQLEDKQRSRQLIARAVGGLPPRERACVLLKDALDCTLEETAEIVGASVGAVKAALHRGRDKLAAEPLPAPPMPAAQRALIERYLDAFNRHDWPAVRALVADDARLQVVHRSEGAFRESSYFTNYAALAWRWKLAIARVDGREAVVHFRGSDAGWVPHAIVQLEVTGDRITHVRDYVHVDDLLRDCDVT